MGKDDQKSPLLTDVTTYETFPRMKNEQSRPLLTDNVERDIQSAAPRNDRIYPNINQGLGSEGRSSNSSPPPEYMHIQQSPNLTSDVGTLMHLLKGNIGTGLLGLPWALHHAGVVIGPLALLMMALICVHCMQLLVLCSNYFCRKLGVPRLDYGQVMYYCVKYGPIKSFRPFASHAQVMVNVFLMITQLGFCCVYFVFMAQNIRQVVMAHVASDSVPEDRLFMVMIAAPILLLVFVRELSFLQYFSTIANFATAGALGIIFYYIFRDGLTEINHVRIVAPVSQWPMFFGTAIYAFEGIGVVLPLENAMRNKQNFPRTLYIGMGSVSILYMSVGILGYMKYGIGICGSITLNLPDDVLAEACKILYSLVIFIGYLLQFYVPIQILDPWIKRQRRPMLTDALLRTFIVALTCACAAAIPNIGDYIALIGACSSSFLALIFPPLIQFMTFHPSAEHVYTVADSRDIDTPVSVPNGVAREQQDNDECQEIGLTNWTYVKNILILTFGLIGFVAGTIVATMNIVHDLESHDENSKCSGGSGLNTTTLNPPHNSSFTTTLSYSSTPSSLSTILLGRP